jgi:hypothetical protein
MVIIAPDASEMAETKVNDGLGRRDRAISRQAPSVVKVAPKALPDNKIERIQSVLTHFLEENDGSDLGKC